MGFYVYLLCSKHTILILIILSTAKKFATQTAVYGISTIITRSLYFILTPIYVSILSASVYGIFTKMYSFASLLTAVLSFGMETAFFRYINKYPEDKKRIFNNSLLMVLIVCLLFLSIIYTFNDFIASWLNEGSKDSYEDYIFYIWCLSSVLVLDALCVVPFAMIRSEDKAVKYSLIKIFNIVIVVALNLFFLFCIPYIIEHNYSGASWFQSWYRPHWVGYVFLSNSIASVCTALVLLPYLTKLRFKLNIPLLKEMIFYSWPILISNISFIINENIDKIMLGKLLPSNINEQQLGIYGACAKIALFLSLFIQAFRLGAEPFFFNHAKNKNAGETYSRIMNYFIIVVCVFFIALVANIEILKYFIKGNDPVQQALYWSGLPVVPLLLTGYISLGIYINLSVWYKLSDQTKYGLYISVIGATLTIVLNIIFIPRYSFMACAWIALITYTTMMLLCYFWGQKHYPIPYNVKKGVLYILSAGTFVFLSFVVFDRNLIIGNLLLLVYLATIVFVEKKDFMSILKRINNK